MEFDVRVISLIDAIAVDARTTIDSVMGKEIEFRTGIRYSIKLPDSPQQFAALSEPETMLTAFSGWARVYRSPDGLISK